MEADLHAIVGSIRLSVSASRVTECSNSPPRSDPSSHSPTLVSGLLLIRSFAVSSTSTPLTSFIATSSWSSSWLTLTELKICDFALARGYSPGGGANAKGGSNRGVMHYHSALHGNRTLRRPTTRCSRHSLRTRQNECEVIDCLHKPGTCPNR